MISLKSKWGCDIDQVILSVVPFFMGMILSKYTGWLKKEVPGSSVQKPEL